MKGQELTGTETWGEGKMDHILFNTAVSAAKIPVALDDMRGYVWQS
jgi:hypothetical protein